MQISLEKVIYGGQSIGTLEDGKKIMAWGGLPGEVVSIRVTKKKSNYVEGVVEQVVQPSANRIAPRDPDSYLSTSPWQIVNFQTEQQLKSQLIREAFELHHVELDEAPVIYSDGREYEYRNKVEFSWYSDLDIESNKDSLDLAFFRRGSKGKVVVDGTSLAMREINALARAIRDLLRTKPISARNLKSLIIRANQQGACTWQLYLKDKLPDIISAKEAEQLPAQGGELIYSNPKSPASRITERLQSFGHITLTDTILDTPFRYATESFFQVNIPIYEQALRDMREWVADRGVGSSRDTKSPAQSTAQASPDTQSEAVGNDFDNESVETTNSKARRPILDLYSGVGTIGLTMGSDDVTLVEIDEHAVREMRENITRLGKKARVVLAPSEQALDHISTDKIIIVDPPRAGLHQKLIDRLLEQEPPRIIYLSCNPATQARDVSLLLEKYRIAHIQGYNFFPRTPHIENLVILDHKD